MKGSFKIKNIYNFTTEQIKGTPLKYGFESNGMYPFLGYMTHADKDYLYGEFEHNEDMNVMIEFNHDGLFTMEIDDNINN